MFEVEVGTSKQIQPKWTELATISYTGSCLTHIIHLFDQHQQICLLTAAGDGCFAIWRTELDLTLVTVQGSQSESKSHLEKTLDNSLNKRPSMIHKVHQSSIKFCHVLPFKALCSKSTYLAVSGGDDNAIGLTFIQFPELKAEGDIKRRTLLIPNAHAASVVSIQAFWEIGYEEKAQTGTFPIRVVSLGADQRVKMWSVALDLHDEEPQWKVQRLSDRYTAVADPGCLDICNAVDDENKVTGIIVGIGLEHWDFGLGHVSKPWIPVVRSAENAKVEKKPDELINSM
jgi:hypothetical protein